jgi:catechol 2,3-dioxygenase-like lactoylglutathione lyase family enzyme
MKAEPTLSTIGGIHHVTSIAADPKRTEEFYAGTLGLHLVRKTVNFDEPSVLHFYFGDPRGSPGSMITFFVHEAELPGRCGTGYVNSIVFAVPAGTLQSWRGRLIARGADVIGTAWSFGEECVCFRDPDGLELALIEEASDAGPSDHEAKGTADQSIRRIRSVEIQIEGFQHTSKFLTERLGFEEFGQEGAVFRFLDGPPDRPIAVDLLCTPTHRPGRAGPGVAHYIALRVDDSDALAKFGTMLANYGFDVTPALDRQYYHAIYFRGPCGVHFAIATDGPGFAITDPDRGPGETLSLPPWLEPNRTVIERRLRSRNLVPADAPATPKRPL